MTPLLTPSSLALAGHSAGDAACPACAAGHPLACRCGGLVHAADGVGGEDGPEDGPEGCGLRGRTCCDACGTHGGAMPPLLVDGEPHLAGRAGCPGCPATGPAACRCGGLIHCSLAGGRRCDGCGGRWEELDI